MLRGVPHILSPELLGISCEVGHNDRVVVADGNFPAESTGRDAHVIHMEGHDVPEILEAVLSFSLLDTYVEHSVRLMSVMDGGAVGAPIWDQYMTLAEACDNKGRDAIGYIERFVFYGETKRAYAIIATSEKTLHTNTMLQEGVITGRDL